MSIFKFKRGASTVKDRVYEVLIDGLSIGTVTKEASTGKWRAGSYFSADTREEVATYLAGRRIGSVVRKAEERTRERCATLAQNPSLYLISPMAWEAAREVGNAIAEAIRAGAWRRAR